MQCPSVSAEWDARRRGGPVGWAVDSPGFWWLDHLPECEAKAEKVGPNGDGRGLSNLVIDRIRVKEADFITFRIAFVRS